MVSARTIVQSHRCPQAGRGLKLEFLKYLLESGNSRGSEKAAYLLYSAGLSKTLNFKELAFTPKKMEGFE